MRAAMAMISEHRAAGVVRPVGGFEIGDEVKELWLARITFDKGAEGHGAEVVFVGFETDADIGFMGDYLRNLRLKTPVHAGSLAKTIKDIGMRRCGRRSGCSRAVEVEESEVARRGEIRRGQEFGMSVEQEHVVLRGPAGRFLEWPGDVRAEFGRLVKVQVKRLRKAQRGSGDGGGIHDGFGFCRTTPSCAGPDKGTKKPPPVWHRRGRNFNSLKPLAART